jgi:glutathione synthase/RimK-type ligase-like ATP-grasp enzyme
LKLYSYNNGSASAKALAAALDIRILKHEGKPIRFRGPLINWGNSKNITRHIECGGCLNPPEAVRNAVNKLQAFRLMSEGVNIPEFTESHQEAVNWLNEGSTIVIRNKLNGHSAEGLEIVNPNEAGEHDDLPEAPLYTKYIKKQHEWRIHVFKHDGVPEVFFVQRKARKLDVPDEEVNWQVRNLAGGFIYSHVNVEAPENVKSEATNAIMALNLDFGAVDVITKKNGEAYVLECNTACGLQGSTLEAYAEQFRRVQARLNVEGN